MVEPMIEQRAGDADAATAHVGEVGQPEPARRMLLPENDVLLGAVQCPPSADAPLQSAADTGTELRMAPPDLVENGDRPQARGGLEQRHHLTVPNRRQRVMPPATTRGLPLRWEPGVLFNAIGGSGAEPGFGGGNARRFGLADTHEQPHLAIGDVATGQGVVPHRHEEPPPTRPAAIASQRAPSGAAPFAGFATSVGLRPPAVTNPATLSHPD